MKLTPISAGDFHCDGGALFGVIPKVLWEKVYPANEKNFTRLTLRSLLVEQGNEKILIDTGIGNHYPEKHLINNGVTAVDQLEKALFQQGITSNEITAVVFTHLHWDHCTGAVKNRNGKLKLTFPNATLWCSKIQWEHARVSNPREQAAFHLPLLDFMAESGKLRLVEKEGELFPNLSVRFFHGHTPGLMIPFIQTPEFTFVYTSDLIPTSANIPLLWISAYDLDPVRVMEEKARFLEEAVTNKYILFFEHDYYTECATLQKTEKGFGALQQLSLHSIVSEK